MTIPGLEGRSVAVVGRAASMVRSGAGADIDAQDVVIRVNWMLPLAAPAVDVGARTNFVYYCGGCRAQANAALRHGATPIPVDRGFRKALAKGSRLSHKIYRPNTGCVAIFHALASGAREVHAFGFDFYRSGYAAAAPPWKGKRALKWRHSPEEDRHLLMRLYATDSRFLPDQTLRQALGS